MTTYISADCDECEKHESNVKESCSGRRLCKLCFINAFEDKIHRHVTENKLFKTGEKVALAVSGGKDSTVLAYTMKTLNKRYDYGLKLRLLAIDEGIKGYRDDSLDTVKQNEADFEIPLTILSYKDLFGRTMDEIVEIIGNQSNCTFCGVFRRAALDVGAKQLGVEALCTGHNADDQAETILMNLLRGDLPRLKRMLDPPETPHNVIRRVKPLGSIYEKDLVMYAYFKKLLYFSTECLYSPNAYRGNARELVKEFELVNSQSVLDIIHGCNQLYAGQFTTKGQTTCESCGLVASNTKCNKCVLLERLDTMGAKKENRQTITIEYES